MAVRDIIVVSVLLFAFGIAFLFFNRIGHDITNNLKNNSQINATPEAVSVLNSTNNVINKMDYIYFGLFLGLAILTIVASWFVGGYPLFTALYFLMIILFVVFSTILKAIWTELSSKAIFSSTLINLPITNHLLTNLPMYTAIIGLIGVIVMFAKPYIAEQTP